MKIAVLSDIHGNLEALDAVWSDALRLGAERFICLGDLIGYGPDPQAVTSKLALARIPAVQGNHEKALFSPHLMERMSHDAVASLHHAATVLSPDARHWLSALPRSLTAFGARFVHGAPPQSVLRYGVQCKGPELRKRFSLYPERICFTGHTHVQTLIREKHGKILAGTLSEGGHLLRPGLRYICGVGSVGQPRGNGKDAEYVLWTPERNEILARRVSYERELTVAKLRALRFPARLAAMLQ